MSDEVDNPVPTTNVLESSPPESPSPTIQAPQPTTSRYLRATSPAREYPLRSVSPDLIPDAMHSRLNNPGLAARRLTPEPGAQMAKQNGVNGVNGFNGVKQVTVN